MLGRLVTEAAERWGDRTAFVSSEGWTLSYHDLDRASDETAVGLLERGVAEGDVVALALPPVPEYVALYAAAAKIGAITAGVNARLTGEERDAVLATARPRVVISTPDLTPRSLVGDVDLLEVAPADSSGEMLAALRTPKQVPPSLPDDPERPVAVVFTSGTTGRPKGAVFGDRQLHFVTEIDTGWKWGGGSHAIAGTSLAHLGPMTKLAGNLVRGSTQHLMSRWTARDALKLVEAHRVAGLGGIPTQIALMLRDPEFDTFDLSSVKAIVIGGGPATPSLVREARSRFNAALSVRYSCTEAGIGVGTGFTDPDQDAELTVGRPHPGVDLLIIGDEGRSLPQGEVGEVCLRSPAVMSEYFGDPAATVEAFTPEGAVRTGDLGYLDDRARLRLVGRAKEMYVRGGYNVFPMEVESVFAEHPQVADVAVVPRSDDVMGEVGVAFVVLANPGSALTLDELRRFGEDHLARHKLPEELRFVDALPLTPMDKLDRRALRSLL